MRFLFIFLFAISYASQSEFEQSVKQFFIEDKPLFDQMYGFQNIKLIINNDDYGGSAYLLKKELLIGKNKESFFKTWYFYKKHIPNEEYLYYSEPEISLRENLKKYIPIAQKSRDYLIKHGFLNNPEEEKMLIDFTIFHELAHLYFKDRNKYSFHYIITHIYNGSFSSVLLRDEFYADLVAFKMMKQKYKNTEFIEKIRQFRVYMGFFYAVELNQPYIHYFFKDIDVNNLPDIKSYVDDIFIKTLKMFIPQEVLKQSDRTVKKIRQKYEKCIKLNEKEKFDCYNALSIDPNKTEDINKEYFPKEVKQILSNLQ